MEYDGPQKQQRTARLASPRRALPSDYVFNGACTPFGFFLAAAMAGSVLGRVLANLLHASGHPWRVCKAAVRHAQRSLALATLDDVTAQPELT